MRRHCIALIASSLIAFACTVEEPPECDIDDGDEVACTCESGTEGRLVCHEGLADCICEDDPQPDAGGGDQ